MTARWVLVLALGGCPALDADDLTARRDADGDGYAGIGGPDCDDGDPTVHPGAQEVWYDGVDQDCDGRDEDADGDGQIRIEAGGTDCDDSDPRVALGLEERFYDGVDQACDGGDDYDADGDGHVHFGFGGGDCNDRDPEVHPGADERPYDGIDQDCSGTSDYDADGDGVDAIEHGGTDCRDDDATISPEVDERCDGVDNDCDLRVDAGAVDALRWYLDQDGDGYGTTDQVVVACTRPEGFVALAGDCADFDPTVLPGAVEVWYDGVDQDCAGDDDFDQDGDGHPLTFSAGGDCDDTDPDRYPGAPEDGLDAIDHDCDGARYRTVSTLAATASWPVGPGAAHHAPDARLADVDGDGLLDYVAATLATARLEVVQGPLAGDLSQGSVPVALGSPDTLPGSRLLAHDLDGDGDDDLLIANPGDGGTAVRDPLAPRPDVCGSLQRADGGGAGPVLRDAALARCAEAGDGIGRALALDGDAVWVGAPSADRWMEADGAGVREVARGRVYRLPDVDGSLDRTIDAAATTTLVAADDDEYLGATLEVVDLDGDGVDELLVGAPAYVPDLTPLEAFAHRGRAYVVPADVTGTVAIADVALATLEGHAPSRYDASATPGAMRTGDVDGDGRIEILVAAPHASVLDVLGGAVMVWEPTLDGGITAFDTLPIGVVGDEDRERLGHAFDVGDLDADGIDDLVVSTRHTLDGTGSTYVFYGPLTRLLTLADANVRIDSPSGGAGIAWLRVVPDLDGDGRPELLGHEGPWWLPPIDSPGGSFLLLGGAL